MATSTAYALFHQIVRHRAFDFLPKGSESEIAEIVRWHTHTGTLDAAGLVIDAASTTPLSLLKSGGPRSR